MGTLAKTTGAQVANRQIEEQADTSQLLGNILVQRGFCADATLKSALRRQGYLNRVGGILLRLDYITHGQLEQALLAQNASGQLLGQAVVTMGFCTVEQVQQALEVRRDLLRLGRRLVRAKIITRGQLLRAREAAKHSSKPIGEVLLQLGFLTHDQVRTVIAAQAVMNRRLLSSML